LLHLYVAYMIGCVKTASISVLRAQLRRFLAAVRRGESIVITERDAPIARLVPIEKAETSVGRQGPAWFQELARRGVLRVGRMRGCPELIDVPPPGPARGSGVVDALVSDRRTGR
jgi:prevent-host-death family protein